ncbi:MAG: neutral zinc metallopeptidase [Microbacteriaceae bacterium]|nr:neutral zinc metallopeptidase [Microbacteriaceae bacterium]
MTFNEGADLDPSRVRRRSRGATAGIAVGGVGIGAIVIALVSSFLGVDLSGILGGGGGGGTSQVAPGDEAMLTNCKTGADANADAECRILGAENSLTAYWSGVEGGAFQPPSVVIFDEATPTACGTGTTAMGPFYCPPDQTIYVDLTFWNELRTKFGTNGGPLAEMYVIAHEYGHHIENVSGVMDGLDLQATGADSDSVRLELMADCLAGSWVAAAANTTDAGGTAFLKPPTREELTQALEAAAAVGDDHIQETLGGGYVNPESWTHGSSQARVGWFAVGYDEGWRSCQTFGISAQQLANPR